MEGQIRVIQCGYGYCLLLGQKKLWHIFLELAQECKNIGVLAEVMFMNIPDKKNVSKNYDGRTDCMYIMVFS